MELALVGYPLWAAIYAFGASVCLSRLWRHRSFHWLAAFLSASMQAIAFTVLSLGVAAGEYPVANIDTVRLLAFFSGVFGGLALLIHLAREYGRYRRCGTRDLTGNQ